MTIYKLHKEQPVRRPPAAVFSFFEKPENLPTITPPSPGFRIATPLPFVMKEGAVFEYTVRVMRRVEQSFVHRVQVIDTLFGSWEPVKPSMHETGVPA